MKRFVVLFMVLVPVLALAQGCIGLRTVSGSGDVAEESREVETFSAIVLKTVGNVVVELGDETALRIVAQENLLRHIEAEVSDDVLEIGTANQVNIVPTQPIFYYVTLPELVQVKVSGLGNVNVPDQEVDRLSVLISGGGDVDIEGLEATDLEVTITGLGDLNIEGGEVEHQTVRISGGGNYRARDVASDTAAIDIPGLGSATVWVRNRLEVTISGGGSVRYFGEPTLDETVTGLGKVERIGE